MPGKFQWTSFADCDIWDAFFNSLKDDYPEFSDWFARKARMDDKAFIYKDERGICAFLYLKPENEAVELIDKKLPAVNRLKIGTLKLSDRIQGQRLGEGILGVAQWRWQESSADEVYVTIFPKHETLVDLVERFGFTCAGVNKRGERVYIKNKNNLDYSNPFKSFPFINPSFTKAGYIPVYDYFHDTLFPYSELYNTIQEAEESSAANGITKIFIGSPSSRLHHKVGEPVVIYRIHTGTGQKIYKSVATSYCTLTNIQIVKNNSIFKMSFEDFCQRAGNKTVYPESELRKLYSERSNLVLLELVYNGYFGKGKNVTCKTLKDNGLFNSYPYNIQLSKQQFISVLEMGGKNVQNVIIN